MPSKFSKTEEKFETYGYFCSFECMKAYNLSLKNGSLSIRQSELITLMRHKTTGQKPGITRPAPSRYALQKFGGPLSIDEFRSPNNYIVNLPHQVWSPVMVSSAAPEETYYEEREEQSHYEHDSFEEQRKREVLTLLESAKGDDAPKLKLKRSLPEQRSAPGIQGLLVKMKTQK